MKGNFEQSLKYTLIHEGGVSDDAGDPGGLTCRGVTHEDWAGYCRKHGIKGRAVTTITLDEAQALYKEEYWDTVRGDDLPAGVDFAVFDASVMSGPSRGIRWLQAALGMPQTGKMTQAVIDTAARTDSHLVLHKVCDLRLAFCLSLKKEQKFFKGWTSRIKCVEDVEAERLRIAAVRGQSADLAPANPLSQIRPLRFGDTGEAVTRLQTRLRGLGYPAGIVDGIFGRNTEAAVARFQTEHILDGESGVWQPSYDSIIDTAAPLQAQRAGLTAKQLSGMGDKTASSHLVARRWLAVGSIGGMFGKLADALGLTGGDTVQATIGQVRGVLDPLQDLWGWCGSHVWIFVSLLAVAGFIYVETHLKAHVDAVKTGDAQGPGGA
jgi:lysozyme family protein